MKYAAASMALVAVLMAAAPATASNELILRNPDDLANLAVLNVEGSYNRLVIEQTRPGEGSGNTVRITIAGDHNGGPVGSKFTGVAVQPGLTPGHIVQNGFGNEVALSVRGNANLFAVAQLGNGNAVQGAVVGYSNQAAVTQTGNHNFASFTQNGIGNIISVRQTSW